jgi:DNA polymerase
VTISGTRGRAIPLDESGEGWVTIHPSYLLRIREKADAEREYERFVADLTQAKARTETR